MDAIRNASYENALLQTDKKHRSRLTPPSPFPRPGKSDTPASNGRVLVKPTRAFDSPAEFMAWRAGRLKSS